MRLQRHAILAAMAALVVAPPLVAWLTASPCGTHLERLGMGALVAVIGWCFAAPLLYLLADWRRWHCGDFRDVILASAAVGLLAPIAYSNFVGALQRSAQVDTIEGLRAIGTTLDALQAEGRVLPDFDGTLADFRALVDDPRLDRLPAKDGWGWQFLVSVTGGSYAIRSRCSCGEVDGPATGVTTDFRHDIVFSAGRFVTWPEGTQN